MGGCPLPPPSADELYWIVQPKAPREEFSSPAAAALLGALRASAERLGYTVKIELGDVPLDQLQRQAYEDEQGVPCVIASGESGETAVEVKLGDGPPERYYLFEVHTCASGWWRRNRRSAERVALRSDFHRMLFSVREEFESEWWVIPPEGKSGDG